MKKWFANSAVLPFGDLGTIWHYDSSQSIAKQSKLRMYTAENSTATKEYVMNCFDDLLAELRLDL